MMSIGAALVVVLLRNVGRKEGEPSGPRLCVRGREACERSEEMGLILFVIAARGALVSLARDDQRRALPRPCSLAAPSVPAVFGVVASSMVPAFSTHSSSSDSSCDPPRPTLRMDSDLLSCLPKKASSAKLRHLAHRFVLVVLLLALLLLLSSSMPGRSTSYEGLDVPREVTKRGGGGGGSGVVDVVEAEVVEYERGRGLLGTIGDA